MEVQWPLLIFSVLLGMGSGLLVFIGIGELKGAFKKVRFVLAVSALGLLAAGGIASTFHLGHIDRAFHILGNLNSAFSHELFAVAFAAIVALVYAVLSRKDYPGAAKAVGILALIAGIVLPLTAGISFMMPARPAWDSFTLPLMYLGTGLGMGLVLGAAIVYVRGDAEDATLALRVAIIGVACSIVTMVAYVAAIAMAPFGHESRSLARLTHGSLAVEFWVGVVLLGIVVPAALVALAAKRNTTAVAGGEAAVKQSAGLFWGAFVGLVIGSVVLRTIMYAVATSVESLIY